MRQWLAATALVAAIAMAGPVTAGQQPEDDVGANIRTQTRLDAEHGLSYAQVNLGGMYEEGIHDEPDFAEAAKWYRRAADQCPSENFLSHTNLM
jgi:TPR repeat protein